MKKNVISGFCAGVVMILLSWILGISIPSVVAVIVATLVFFCVTGFVLVDNWKKWNTLAWYYWVMIGLLLAGAVVGLMATTWGSPKWSVVGICLIVAGVILYAIFSGKLKAKQ